MRTQYGAGTLFQSQTRCFAVIITQACGTQWGFTDWAAPFSFLNPVTSENVVCQPVDGVDVSNIAQQIGTQDSNLEIKSLLNDSLNRITKEELISGRFTGATVYVYVVDPLALDSETGLATNYIVVGRYRFSKVTMRDSDFSESLHGLEVLLKNQVHRTMGSSCDVRKFGDLRCDPSQTLRAARTFALTVSYVPDVFIIDFANDSDTNGLGPGYFAFGDGKWTAGASVNVTFEMLKHYVPPVSAYSSSVAYPTSSYVTYEDALYVSLQAGNTGHTPGTDSAAWLAVEHADISLSNPIARIVLRTPMMLAVQPGDTADLCFGCDRQFATCQGVANSHNASLTNIENFQGFPGLPQPDLTIQVGRQS